MADLDAELLALAGGDSSSDESPTSPPREKSSSPVYDKRGSSTARKSTSRNIKQGRRRTDHSDDEGDK